MLTRRGQHASEDGGNRFTSGLPLGPGSSSGGGGGGGGGGGLSGPSSAGGISDANGGLDMERGVGHPGLESPVGMTPGGSGGGGGGGRGHLARRDSDPAVKYAPPQVATRRRMWTLIAVLLTFLCLVYWWGSGMRHESGFAYDLTQCMFKTYGSLDTYQRSGIVYDNATDVLLRQSDMSMGHLASAFPTDKLTRHNYTLYYDILLKPYLRRPNIRILEIGVKKGGSIKMWRELFPEDAWVYGVDIDPGVPTFVRDGHIKILVLDTTKEDVFAKAVKGLKFDIILDDGLHNDWAQYVAFRTLASLLEPDGVYIIEDVLGWHPAYYTRYRLPMSASLHSDPSGEQVAFLYPPLSRAPKIEEGLIMFSPAEAPEPDRSF